MRRLALLVLLLVILLIVLLLFWRHCGPSPVVSGCTAPCTAAGQCTLIMPLPYTAEQAVLSATSSLVLGAGSAVGASNGVPGAVANLGAAPTAVGDHATLGSIVSEASVALGAGAHVNGPLTTSGAVLNPSGAVVQGKVTTNASIAADRHVMMTVTFPATAPAVTVGSGATRILAPGSYGDVRVSAGGTLSLSAGTYRMASLAVLPQATLDLNETAGTIQVYVKNSFELAGKENQVGGDGHVLIAAFGCAPDVVAAPFRGTVSAQNASLSLVAPAGTTFAGRYFASSIQLGPNNSVAGLAAAWPSNPPAPGTRPARLPPPLPAPPPPVVGCYVNTRNGWKNIPCATDAFIRSHFPLPDAQLTVSSSATPSLVFGQLAVTVPAVASEADGFVASTCSISPLCTCSGAAVPNKWSVQSNTNQWTVPATAASGAGDTAAVQFVIQSNGSTSAICIWNVDVTAQTYPHQCVTAQQRAGGLKPFDTGNLAATVNSNGTLSLVTQLSWVPSGQPNQYAVVIADTHGLAGNWTAVSGGLIGMGSCSQAQLANAEIVTQAVASTCAGDTDGTSSVCPPPALQPNAAALVGGTGTVETNNLTAVGSPSVSYPNSDLVVTNMTSTTSGSCLGPSHAYVMDNPIDYGATPSNLGDQVFWESPDIFLVPHGTPVDVNAVSTETLITPGGSFDIWIRVHNDLGCTDVTGVKTLVYLADPSALSAQWTPVTNQQYVGNNGGPTGVTAPAGGQALIGPLPFTAPASGIGDGHKCIIAAIEADGEAAPANNFDAPNSNQVAQRNIQFVGPCVYPLTNGTSSNGNAQITLSIGPATGTAPSLTALPDVEVVFDDSDASWFNAWNSQTGNGSTFAVTHSGSSTTVRLGAFSVALNSVPLAAGQTRTATGTVNLPSGSPPATLQIAASLTETGAGGKVLVANGGSCVANAPVIIK
jgi:hypothetical protein